MRTAILACVALSLACAGCSSAHGTTGFSAVSTPGAASAFRGDRLPAPQVLSAADQADTFRSSAGGTTTLARLQQGRLMLLYFGYTHCPDVCPTTMADLGAALRQLPVIVQGHTQVVFVTSDPARDTPAVMKAWLANFDQGLPLPYVGLTASVRQIDAVASSVGVPLEPPVKQPNGSITVQHGAQTLAFINGRASLLWTAGTSPADYAHDISALIMTVGRSSAPSSTAPSSTAPSSMAPATGSARRGALSITAAYVPQPASPDVAAAYLTVTNRGSRADVLERVTSSVTSRVMPMTETSNGTTGAMADLGPVRIPAHGSFRFMPDHAHLMLESPDHPLRAGQHVQLRLTFRYAGTVTVDVPVVSMLGPGGGASMAPMSGMSP